MFITNWRTLNYVIILIVSSTLGYQLSSNGGATVHGTRARNSSIPLRSVLANQHEHNDQHCDYCHPKECIDEDEDSEDGKFIYCYVERDNENGFSDDQVCVRSDVSLKRLVKSDNLDGSEWSDCQSSKRSPFVSICWCRIQATGDDFDSSKDLQQLTELNRIRFNSGRRGGLQVVRRLQSAEDTRSSGEPQLKTRVRLDSPTTNISLGLSSINVQVAKQSSQDPSTASKSIAQRPIIHTIPRRPSPSNSFNLKANLVESKLLTLTGLILLFMAFNQ